MAYLYRHIRLDKNIPFYIGIGSDIKGRYLRSKSTQNRNKIWHNIVTKAGYEIEIIIDDISWEDACQKEMEFILLYGRKSNGGVLCNLTDGGGGGVGMLVSDETRQKQSLKKKGKTAHNKGKPMPKDQLEKLVAVNTGRPAWNKGKLMSDSMREKCRIANKGRYSGENHPMYGRSHTPMARKKMSEKAKGKSPWSAGLKMTDEWRKKNKENKPKKVVLQYDVNGTLVSEFISCSEAARQTGLLKTSISRACLKIGKTKTYKGYIWKYKEVTASLYSKKSSRISELL